MVANSADTCAINQVCRATPIAMQQLGAPSLRDSTAAMVQRF
jgi:hypothetical protein